MSNDQLQSVDLMGSLVHETTARATAYGASVEVIRGRKCGQLGSCHLYSCAIAEHVYAGAETPAVLTLNGIGYPVTVVERRLNLVRLRSPFYLGQSWERGRLVLQSGKLLDALTAGLRGIAATAPAEDSLLNELLVGSFADDPRACATPIRISIATDLKLNPEQEEALNQILTRRVTHVAGPFRAGKKVIASVAAASLCRSGQSVLVVTRSGSDADAVVTLITDILGESAARNGTLVRALSAFSADVPECCEGSLLVRLGAKSGLSQRLLELSSRIFRLQQKLDLGAGSGNESGNLREELRSKLDEFVSLEKSAAEEATSIVAEAKIVVVTYSDLVLVPAIFQRAYDTGLMMDAGSTPMPWLVLAGALIKNHLAVFGDIYDLPPAGPWQPADYSRYFPDLPWMHQSSFDWAGLTSMVAEERPTPGLVRLRQQYFVAPAVTAALNRGVYPSEWRLQTEQDKPCGPGVVIYDLSRLRYRPQIGPRATGCKPGYALLSFLMAHYWQPARGQAVILALDDAQIFLHDKLFSLATDSPRVMVATLDEVRDFRASVCIIDATDAVLGGRKYWIGGNLAGSRLLNLALTRAEQNLVICADLTAMRQGEPGSLSQAVLAFVLEGAPVHSVPLEDLFDQPVATQLGLTVYPDPAQGWSKLEEDLRSASSEVFINWPEESLSTVFSPEYLAQVLNPAANRTVAGPLSPQDGSRLASAKVELLAHSHDEFMVLIDDSTLWIVGHPAYTATRRPAIRIKHAELSRFIARACNVGSKTPTSPETLPIT